MCDYRNVSAVWIQETGLKQGNHGHKWLCEMCNACVKHSIYLQKSILLSRQLNAQFADIVSVESSFIIRKTFLNSVQSKFQISCFTITLWKKQC